MNMGYACINATLSEQLSGVVMCEECNGGNTTERVEEQAARLEKIAEQKNQSYVVDER